MAFHYSPNITTDGLILYMDPANTRSYTGTGVTWSNLAIVNDGLLSSVTYNSTTKSFDTNVTFSTESNNISCVGITFSDTNEYTLDFWVKFRPGIPTSTINTIFGYGISGTSIFTLNTTTATSWQPTFQSQTGGTQYYFTPINYDLTTNWGNITLVVKSNRNIDLYLNSVYKQTVITTNTSFSVNKIASGFNSGPPPTYYHALQGSISATKIYNRALSLNEVERNYLSLKSRFGL